MSSQVKKRGRRLSIRDQVWQWTFSDPLCIWDPNDKRYEFDLFGYGVDRDIEKRNFSLTPREVREIIERKILGYDDLKGFPAGVLPTDFVMGRREGYDMVSGPRGKWQVKVDFMTVDLISPEGVYHKACVTDMMGDEWMKKLNFEVSRLYPIMTEHLASPYSSGDIWLKMREVITVPNINFKGVRNYLHANYGMKEEVA